MLAVHGIDTYVEHINQKKHAQFLRQLLTHNDEYNAYLSVIVHHLIDQTQFTNSLPEFGT